MYYHKFFPFYATYSNPMLYDGERIQEKEFELMKSYYPETARMIQEKVERECDLMDYEGSRMYDDYPDKYMLYETCRRIRREMEGQMEAQAMPEGVLGDLIQVLLHQEVFRRRCRRHRCRRFF